jgi:nucleotide-binding universal stress UspA family protein
MKVLIAIDGSEFSKVAVDEACWKVLKATDEIKIVSAVEPFKMVVGAPFGVVNDFYYELKEEAFKQANDYLAKAAARIREDFPDQEPETEILYGNAAEMIVEKAIEWGADLIITGSHGRGFLARTVLGSVSKSVVNHAPCSVLVVRKPEGVLVETR